MRRADPHLHAIKSESFPTFRPAFKALLSDSGASNQRLSGCSHCAALFLHTPPPPPVRRWAFGLFPETSLRSLLLLLLPTNLP